MFSMIKTWWLDEVQTPFLSTVNLSHIFLASSHLIPIPHTPYFSSSSSSLHSFLFPTLLPPPPHHLHTPSLFFLTPFLLLLLNLSSSNPSSLLLLPFIAFITHSLFLFIYTPPCSSNFSVFLTSISPSFLSLHLSIYPPPPPSLAKTFASSSKCFLPASFSSHNLLFSSSSSSYTSEFPPYNFFSIKPTVFFLFFFLTTSPSPLKTPFSALRNLPFPFSFQSPHPSPPHNRPILLLTSSPSLPPPPPLSHSFPPRVCYLHQALHTPHPLIRTL